MQEREIELDPKVVSMIRYFRKSDRRKINSKLKIQMLCYFADVAAYVALGAPITKAEYCAGKGGVRMRHYSRYWRMATGKEAA